MAISPPSLSTGIGGASAAAIGSASGAAAKTPAANAPPLSDIDAKVLTAQDLLAMQGSLLETSVQAKFQATAVKAVIDDMKQVIERYA
jgi:hypothetical protein